MKALKFFLFLFITVLSFTACDETDVDDILDELENLQGWDGSDDFSEMPMNIDPSLNSENLLSSYDLSSYFPPARDQGDAGTCVAWASAYYTKSAMNAINNNISSNNMAFSNNQFSPLDLFLALDEYSCNGTSFEHALETMKQRGVATMATAPYDDYTACNSYGTESSWDASANQNKIDSWRRISGEIGVIKTYIANNIPVIFGAGLDFYFDAYDGSGIIDRYHSSIQGYHAMVIVGYDDSKRAVKIINSWGPQWGNSGFAWIDYDFLVDEFGRSTYGQSTFFILNDNSINTPSSNNTSSSSIDFETFVFSDIGINSSISNEREITFNVYNNGQGNAASNNEWDLTYIYYNAYDANDYGVLFSDRFTSTIPHGNFDCYADGCLINIDIPSGGSFSSSAFGEDRISRGYNVPTHISGEYFLVLISDFSNVIAENDELNNMGFTSQDPIYFQNGFANFNDDNSSSNRSSNNNKLNSKMSNAYSKKEILGFLKNEIKVGNLNQKIEAYKAQNQHMLSYDTKKK